MAAYINLDGYIITGSNVLSEQVKYSTSRLGSESLKRLHEELVKLKSDHKHDLNEYFNKKFDFGAGIEDPEKFIDIAIIVVSDAMQEREVKEETEKLEDERPVEKFTMKIVNVFFKEIESLLSKRK